MRSVRPSPITALIALAIAFTIPLLVWGTIAYVAYHFISKYW